MPIGFQEYANYQTDIVGVREMPEDAEDWLALTRECYFAADEYQETSFRNQWTKNADHFNNTHEAGSRYYGKDYAKRSKIFRPLVRKSERNSSATAAEALFSNMDMTRVTAQNPDDMKQVNDAKVKQKLLEYRLENDVNWYLTALGAWQDAFVYGPAISYVNWDYAEDEDGVVTKDNLKIDLIAPENFLYDPAADWRDIVGSSPYIIWVVPMYVIDIETKMKDPTSGWMEYERGEILSARDIDDPQDDVRRAREGQDRTDSHEQLNKVADQSFEMVDVLHCIVNRGGKDYVYWTVGTQLLLTAPVPIKEYYFHGKRPFVYGQSVIEAHKCSPNSQSELISELQKEVNEISNQRVDNVRQVLNRRYFVRRGAQVDLAAMARNTPGSSVTMNDPFKDVQVMPTMDVTASSYQETERLNMEADELSGTFSTSTVGNARSLNETVGGMNMLSDSSSRLQNFDIRTFMTTWVEPTLQLALDVINEYETDEFIIALCGEAAAQETDDSYTLDSSTLFDAPSKVRVNAGIGATSPGQRINNLIYGVQSIGQVAPQEIARFNGKEAVKEIMGALGYADGDRFFTPEEQMEPVQSPPTKEMVDLQKLAMQAEENEKDRQLQKELKLMELASRDNISMAEMRTKLAISSQDNKTKRDIEAAKTASRNAEMTVKKNTGSGI